MAEGILRHLAMDGFLAFSSGLNPSYVNPLAVKVMDEIGIDISNQRSKSINEFLGQRFDYIITLCDNAKTSCPVFPGRYKEIHWALQDPASAQGADNEKVLIFREVRNKIKEYILKFLNLPRDKAYLKCPSCSYIQEVIIPKDACLHFYKCKVCNKTISPQNGNCCVICTYSDKNCSTFSG